MIGSEVDVEWIASVPTHVKPYMHVHEAACAIAKLEYSSLKNTAPKFYKGGKINLL